MYLSVGFLDHLEVFEPTYLKRSALATWLRGNPEEKSFLPFFQSEATVHPGGKSHMASQAPSWPGDRLVEALGFQWSG